MTAATTERSSAGIESQRQKPGRINSLDFVRGLFLIASVASESTLPPKPPFLKHSDWFGVTPLDLVFPLFVTLSGCGLAFAYRNRVGWGATLRRSVVLLACGLFYNAIAAQSLDLDSLRYAGPLQVYAVLVLVIGLLHLIARTPTAWALVTTAIAAAHAAFLLLAQSACPGDVFSPACNPSRSVDFALLGLSHVYAAGERGHDPEGLIGVLGALVTACVGVTAGHLALARRGSWRGPVSLVAWATVAFAAAGITSLWLPAMKRLWTTPFALGVAALGVVILAFGMAVMDLPAPRWWQRLRARFAWPLIALGRNSLLVYFGSHLLVLVLRQHGGEMTWAEEAAQAVAFLHSPQIGFLLASLAGWLLIAALLHRMSIYLRP